jgi:hypothetical protein
LHELERGGWIRREQRASGTRLIVLCWRGTPCKDAGGESATLQGAPPAKARTKPIVSVATNGIEPDAIESPERSRPEERQPIAIPPAPPAPPPAAAEPISTVPGGEKVLPPLTALLFPAQAPEAGPREARPAILQAPAGPTPKAEVDPVPGGVVAPAEVNQCPGPVGDPRIRLARSQSELHPELDSPAPVTAPDAKCAIDPPPRVEPPRSAQGPVPGPAKACPALPLTPEQKARLDALPEATANLVLTWLLTGDRILVAEAKKKLVPPRPRPEAPKTLPEVLGRIREDPSFPSLAADWLASALQDRKSYSGFKARCEEAWRGELSVDRLVSAYEQAMGPRAKNPGAIFMVAVRRNE